MVRGHRLSRHVGRAVAGVAAAAFAPVLAVAPAAGQMPAAAHPTSTGDQVRINVSASDPPPDATVRAWADFFGRLPHGRELATLQVDLVEQSEMLGLCGDGAGACYVPAERRAIVAGARALPTPGSAIAETARHEYGHHVATTADNAPWPRGLGTKRWFTAAGVCRRIRRGELVPTPDHGYARSAVEGFAEVFRVVAGGSPHLWIVADDLFPDAVARRALLADLRDPWVGPTTRVVSGRLRGGATRRHAVAVPLDGRVTVTARGARGLRPAVRLVARGRTLARGGRDGRGWRAATTTCGVRRLEVLVSARRGAGAYRLEVSTP